MKDLRRTVPAAPAHDDHAGGGPADAGDTRDEIAALRREIQLRDEFIATAAHELRNPLSPVYMQVEHLREIVRTGAGEIPRAWLLAQLDSLLGRFDRFLDTLNRLLDSSRMGDGRIQLHRTDCDLVEAVLHVLTSYERELAGAGCALQLELPPTLVGHWDRLRLEQIIGNLVSNALRYGAGRPISVVVHDAPHGARLVVRDRGVGIAPEDQTRIFRRFERARNVGRCSGFGVGLWVVAELCRAMGGEVTVESELGHGAAFTVTLPRS